MFKTVGARFVFLLTLLFFSLPFGMGSLINLILFLILINSFSDLKSIQWKKAIKSSVFLVSAAFYLFSLLSLLWSANVSEGLLQLETKLTFLLAPLVLIACTPDVVKKKNVTPFIDNILYYNGMKVMH